MDLNLNMTSTEPSRRKPYSVDIRWRVVWQHIGMDLSFRSIACRLNISVGTAYKLFELTEVLRQRVQGSDLNFCKLDESSHTVCYRPGPVQPFRIP